MDGRSRSRAKQLTVVVLIVIVVFGLVEAAVRARASMLPPPQRWIGFEMPLKERQIDMLQRVGGASAIFLGSSVVDVGADPRAMRREQGRRPYYNAALLAGSLKMIRSWAHILALPKLHPDVVVLGVISREFNPHDRLQQRIERQFFDAPAVRQLLGTETVLLEAERRIESMSALVRYRTFVRQPRFLPALLGVRKVTQTGLGSAVGPLGHYQGWLNREYPETNAGARYRENSLRDYEVGAAQVAVFRRLVAGLKASSKRVVVVSMPVTSDYVDAHPHGEDDYRSFSRTLERETDRLDVELVEMGVWPAVYFADPSHVNRRGTKRISDWLAGVLAEKRPS